MPEASERYEESKIYETTSGIRKYALMRGENTEALISGVSMKAVEEVLKLAKEEIKLGMGNDEILTKYAGKVVASTTKAHMSSGLSTPRIFMGGNYNLEDTISAASCIDAAVFNSLILEDAFGLETEVHKTRLGVVPNHHYIEIKRTGQIIDPILGNNRNPGGFFENKEKFHKYLNIINSGGTSVLIQQVRALFTQEKEPDSNSQVTVSEKGSI